MEQFDLATTLREFGDAGLGLRRKAGVCASAFFFSHRRVVHSVPLQPARGRGEWIDAACARGAPFSWLFLALNFFK
jgi:hypothetical protein